MSLRVFVICSLLLFSVQALSANSEEADFQKNFSIAKQHLSQRQIMKALPYLLYLEEKYPDNLNIKYLIGVCYAEENIVHPKTINLLKQASTKVTFDYNPNTLTEDSVPIYVHYYLSIAYAQNKNCDKAEESRNIFLKLYPYEDKYYIEESLKWLSKCKDMTTNPAEKKLPEFPSFKPYVSPPPPKQPEKTLAVNFENTLKVLETEKNQPPKKKTIKVKKVEYSAKQPLYGVQLGAFKEVIPVSRFENVKNVEAFIDNEGMIRYVVGHFSIQSQAESLLNQIKKRGYPDAFVVDINSEKKFTEEIVSVDDMNIKYNPYKKAEYRVQLGAFKKHLPDKTASIYLNVEGIEEHWENGMTFLTAGKFDNYNEAKKYSSKIKDTGITDAFVIVLNKGKKVPLKEANEFNN